MKLWRRCCGVNLVKSKASGRKWWISAQNAIPSDQLVEKFSILTFCSRRGEGERENERKSVKNRSFFIWNIVKKKCVVNKMFDQKLNHNQFLSVYICTIKNQNSHSKKRFKVSVQAGNKETTSRKSIQRSYGTKHQRLEQLSMQTGELLSRGDRRGGETGFRTSISGDLWRCRWRMFDSHKQ